MRAYSAAAGAALGSWLLLPAPVGLALVCVVVAGLRRTALAVGLALFCVASVVGSRAEAGLESPDPGPVSGWVQLLDDPRPVGPRSVRVTVAYQGKRFDATAHGRVAGRLDDYLAGERLEISGDLKPGSSERQRWRHIVGEIAISEVRSSAAAAPMASLANRIRRLLAGGAESMSREDQALFAGMVYGDDRGQSPRLADDFRAAGLGHLLVVSGQNVAFVVALASPLVSRLRPGSRLVALLVVLGVFAMLTRFEPSVLRAVAMASVAVTSAALGHPQAGRRILAWAIAVVLVIDPFLIHVLAFQLSVCATAGILWLTPPISAALRGPEPLRLAVATTTGAQLAVMPLLLATFGPMPLASLPANVLAGPASGPVMMWGATAGVLAGAVGAPVSWLIHRPTVALMWWVRSVAASAALSPQATLSWAAGASVLVGTGALLRGPRARIAGAALLATVIALSVARAPVPAEGLTTLSGVYVLHHKASTIVVLDQPGSPRQLLETLREAGVRRLDAVVSLDGRASDADAVVALVDRYGLMLVLAPPMHRVPHARSMHAGVAIQLGDLSIEVVEHDPELSLVARIDSGRDAVLVRLP